MVYDQYGFLTLTQTGHVFQKLFDASVPKNLGERNHNLWIPEVLKGDRLWY